MDDSVGSILQSQFQSPLYGLVIKLLQQSMSSTATTPAASTSTTTTTTTPGTQATGSVSGNFANLIKSAAEKYHVNPALISAVIQAESNFNPSATSSAGALGLMQLMPGTAQSLGVSDPLDPAQNIDGGAHFLSELLSRYNGNVQFALAAYNAGPGAVDKYQGIPPYAETQTYVQRVLGYMNSSTGWSA